ncbi:hypothetical protein GCM10020256_29780 [Streptomyces thermocoprophilus]
MVQIKTPEQIAKMRAAGLVVAAIHKATREAAVPGATTKDLDEVARKVLAEHGAKSNFLGYGGFPATICTSVNDVVVHGIPSEDVVLKDGDIISIDCGAVVDGWHGDAAYTAFVGSGHAPELIELSRVTEESMWAGIAAMKQGNRLVDISKAIEQYIRRQPKPGGGRYGIVEDYGGHGIGTEMHMDPHLLNYVDRRRGKGPPPGPRPLPGDRADGVAGHAEDAGAGGRVDGHHDRRHLVLALGALRRPHRAGPAGADRARRGQGEARRVRHHGRPRSAGMTITTVGQTSSFRLSGCADVD